jgi:hypothetical protein
MSTWTIPDWPEPFDPSFEVPILESLAVAISAAHPEIICTPSFEIEGCAFVNFHRDGVFIGHACVTRHESGSPFFSAYLGADEDEFHGFNQQAIVQIVSAYETQLPSD